MGNVVRICVAAVAVALIVYGFSISQPLPPETEGDAVSKACDEYERLFREVSRDIAARLERGDLKTDRSSRDLRSESLKQALKAAFLPLAEEEARRLSPWSPEAEAEMLREYGREER